MQAKRECFHSRKEKYNTHCETRVRQGRTKFGHACSRRCIRQPRRNPILEERSVHMSPATSDIAIASIHSLMFPFEHHYCSELTVLAVNLNLWTRETGRVRQHAVLTNNMILLRKLPCALLVCLRCIEYESTIHAELARWTVPSVLPASTSFPLIMESSLSQPSE